MGKKENNKIITAAILLGYVTYKNLNIENNTYIVRKNKRDVANNSDSKIYELKLKKNSEKDHKDLKWEKKEKELEEKEKELDIVYQITGYQDKFKAIKAIRKILNLGLKEAKELTESLPYNSPPLSKEALKELENAGLQIKKLVRKNKRDVANNSDSKIYELKLKKNSEKDHKDLKWEKKEKPIILEQYSKKTKKISKDIIGSKTNYIPSYNGIKITGGDEVRKYQVRYYREFNEKNSNKNASIDFERGEYISDIIPKSDILNSIKNSGYKIDEKDIELVYYKPEKLDILIPMYHIGTAKESVSIDNYNMLGMYFPASPKYFNNEREILAGANLRINTKENSINKFNTNNNNDEGNGKKKNLNKYEISINLDSNYDINRLDIIGNFKIINRTISRGIYIFTVIGDLSQNRADFLFNNQITINYLNNYDIPTTVKRKIPKLFKKPTILTKIIKPPTVISPIRPKRRDNNDYGIEWGEDVIGGSCYSNYVNYMDTVAIPMYKWTKPNAWVPDFIDKDNGGIDNEYVDDVDISTYIGHGNGGGFNLEGSGPNNGSVTYQEVAKGKAWGNKDLEFQVLLSCQVLRENFDGKKWHERWGPAFNGLHLLCGFQTNASTGTHKHLKYFAEHMYDDNKTVRRAWFDAADRDQPDGYQAVIMGPLISKTLAGDYNSIDATTPGMDRAYWNDKAWGVGGGPGKDVKKENITGWWRVVYTV